MTIRENSFPNPGPTAGKAKGPQPARPKRHRVSAAMSGEIGFEAEGLAIVFEAEG